MLTDLFYPLLLIAGFPTGLLIAKYCKDEIKKWKNMLFIISAICLILIIGIFFSGFQYKFPAIISLFFIIIVCLNVNCK